MQGSDITLDGVSKLRRLAQLAIDLYKGSISCRNGRDDRIFASACDFMPDEPSRLLREVAYESTGRGPGSLFQGGIVTAMFAQGAYEIVREKSISAYWFWKIVAAAAEYATALPLTVDDVKQGIEDLRATYSVDGVGTGSDLQRALNSFAGEELTRLVDAGVVYIHRQWNGTCPNCRAEVQSLRKSPLFLGMDELFYAEGGASLPVTALE